MVTKVIIIRNMEAYAHEKLKEKKNNKKMYHPAFIIRR
jgi:hypothetical protein